jgi:hypothetical protein
MSRDRDTFAAFLRREWRLWLTASLLAVAALAAAAGYQARVQAASPAIYATR